MRIRLISSDQCLYKLCREVLLGFRDREWDFGIASSYEYCPHADLFLWDLQPETQLPHDGHFNPQRGNVFLISRKNLAIIQNRHRLVGCSVVLKPVNPVLLRTLIENAVMEFETGVGLPDCSERDEMLQHLLHANLTLQLYDQDRTNFLAQSVHDFRAPLMAIEGYCALLLENQLGPLNGEQGKVIERMQRSVKRLSRLTAGMFQMSVGPQAPRRLPRKDGDIEACIAQAVHEVTPVVESKCIEVRVQVIPPSEPLYFDDMQIEQVLVNLLDNACRFTPRNGFIEIRAHQVFWDRRCPNLTECRDHADRREFSSREWNAYRVEVRDSGPGVPAQDVERIFEEYTTGSVGGEGSRAGLGLAICRQIINSHHGVVFAETSTQGARFIFMLPYAGKKSRPSAPKLQTSMVAAGVTE